MIPRSPPDDTQNSSYEPLKITRNTKRQFIKWQNQILYFVSISIRDSLENTGFLIF